MTFFLTPPLWWRFIRVRQWYYFAALPLACAGEGAWGRPGVLAWACMLAAASLAYAYGLNSITDASTDRDGQKNPFASGSGVPQYLHSTLNVLPLVALLAAAGLGSLSLAMMATSILAGWLYSGKLRLKRFPVAGLLCNHAIFVPLLYVGGSWSLFGSISHMTMVIGFLALLTQNQLVHELMDWGEDTDAGDRTTAQMLEEKGAYFVCYLLGALTAAAAIYFLEGSPRFVGATALLVATGMIWRYRGAPAKARAAHRWAGLIGSGVFYAFTLG